MIEMVDTLAVERVFSIHKECIFCAHMPEDGIWIDETLSHIHVPHQMMDGLPPFQKFGVRLNSSGLEEKSRAQKSSGILHF